MYCYQDKYRFSAMLFTDKAVVLSVTCMSAPFESGCFRGVQEVRNLAIRLCSTDRIQSLWYSMYVCL